MRRILIKWSQSACVPKIQSRKFPRCNLHAAIIMLLSSMMVKVVNHNSYDIPSDILNSRRRAGCAMHEEYDTI